ncbi:hypothetical protein F5050DRAFT_1900891 [Lentinula boryana]|uniref:Uncharacterized protein n=1 Tax=Lentinula boryana TaxID=40481 RepID=A0ABQ8QL12_9AGAR|nr:hypothetical protein F5050DRAFT_1900891 [Lentinula boryana]
MNLAELVETEVKSVENAFYEIWNACKTKCLHEQRRIGVVQEHLLAELQLSISLSAHLYMFQSEHQTRVNQLAERIAMPRKGISDFWLDMNADHLHTLIDYIQPRDDSSVVEYLGEAAVHGLMIEIVFSLKPSDLWALTFVRSRQNVLSAMFKALDLRAPGLESPPVLSNASRKTPYLPAEDPAEEKGTQLPSIIAISPPGPAAEMEVVRSVLNEMAVSSTRAGFWQDEEALARHFFAYKNERMGRVTTSLDAFHSKWQKFEHRVSRVGAFLEERCSFLQQDYRRRAVLEQRLNNYHNESRESLWLVALECVGYAGGNDPRRDALPQAQINLQDTIDYLQSPQHRPLAEVLEDFNKMWHQSVSLENNISSRLSGGPAAYSDPMPEECTSTASVLTLEADLLETTESCVLNSNGREVTGLMHGFDASEVVHPPLTVANEASVAGLNIKQEDFDSPKTNRGLKSISVKGVLVWLLFCSLICGSLIHLNNFINRRYQEITHTYLDSESRKMLEARRRIPPASVAPRRHYLIAHVTFECLAGAWPRVGGKIIFYGPMPERLNDAGEYYKSRVGWWGIENEFDSVVFAGGGDIWQQDG